MTLANRQIKSVGTMNLDELKLFEKITQPPLGKRLLQIVVNRYFTDVNGTVILKSAAPAAMQVAYPLYLFNEFDRKGGLFFANGILPPNPATKFLFTAIWGYNNPFFFGFTGLSTIQLFINPGDIYTVYTDNVVAPTTFVWVVQSARLSSIGAISSNLGEHGHYSIPYVEQGVNKTHLKTSEFRYYASTEKQWQQSMFLFTTDSIGNIDQENSINPHKIGRKPETINDQFVLIQVPFELNQYFGAFTNILFATDSMEFNFTITN